MTVYLIAAISKNNVIGVDNRLPWTLPYDLKWFQMNTKEGAVIMGRRTWDSLPKKPLPNRLNIILSRSTKIMPENIFEPPKQIRWCNNVSGALKEASRSKKIYIIGGAEIYRDFMFAVDVFILTRIHSIVKGKKMVNLRLPKHKKLVWSSKTFQENGITFHFEIYLKL